MPRPTIRTTRLRVCPVQLAQLRGAEPDDEDKKESAAIDVELMSEGDADEALANAFSVFDADGSGKLSTGELRDILMRQASNQFGPPLSDDEVNEIIKAADVNGDGELDIAEFCALMKGRADL